MIPFAAIADDYTGGADLASMLASRGARTLQCFGPRAHSSLDQARGYDALVWSLKSRSIPPPEAVALSLEACRALVDRLSPDQLQFKYCSTFDSTAQGNIGPVTEALMRELGVPFSLAVPALPVNGRTQYLGYLYVHGQLLSESPLRDHPLNPMREPSLVRHLQMQTALRVGLIPYPVVEAGASSIRERARELASEGVAIALTDCLSERHLAAIAESLRGARFFSGGSGVAAHLDLPHHRDAPVRALLPPGGTLILSGSCSSATLRQLDHYPGPRITLDPRDLDPARLSHAAAALLHQHGRALVTASAPPDQRPLDPLVIGPAIEQALAAVAVHCVQNSLANRLIVAGGETSGAVIDSLAIPAVEILDSLDPGVPALRAFSPQPLALALKSGNFGRDNFFSHAAQYLEAL